MKEAYNHSVFWQQDLRLLYCPSKVLPILYLVTQTRVALQDLPFLQDEGDYGKEKLARMHVQMDNTLYSHLWWCGSIT